MLNVMSRSRRVHAEGLLLTKAMLKMNSPKQLWTTAKAIAANTQKRRGFQSGRDEPRTALCSQVLRNGIGKLSKNETRRAIKMIGLEQLWRVIFQSIVDERQRRSKIKANVSRKHKNGCSFDTC